MTWQSLSIDPGGTHHVDSHGAPAYDYRFDEVLKFHSPGLAPVRRGNEAWHIDMSGQAAYSRRFVRTFGFYEGLAAVTGSDGWGHVTPQGHDAYADRHAWCGNFQGGRCPVRSPGGLYFHIRTDGEPAYAERWRYAGDYRDGTAVVQASDGRSTHIALDGQLLHGRWFLDLDVFHKGFARARDEDGWTHVDAFGVPAYPRRFAAVEPFYNGQARVERGNGALEVIDEHGTTVVVLRPPMRSELASLSADLVGFWRTQTIATGVQLGVIEELPATAEEIAHTCALHLDRAGRLLRALGKLQLATRVHGERWELTERGRLLRWDHPLTLADAALEYAGPLSELWSRLPAALRANSTWTAPDIFGDVARDGRAASHHRMLRSYARDDYAHLCEVLALRGDEQVVDAGGGLGALARLLIEAHPSLQVTVLERPEVVRLAEADSAIHWRAGDLFEPWAVQAEVVLLARVLHDWEDDSALRILEHARAALPHEGRVYIVEMLIPEDGVAGALCDLHLMMATGGRERSAADYRRLLEGAGFCFGGVRRLAALPSVVVGIAS